MFVVSKWIVFISFASLIIIWANEMRTDKLSLLSTERQEDFLESCIMKSVHDPNPKSVGACILCSNMTDTQSKYRHHHYRKRISRQDHDKAHTRRQLRGHEAYYRLLYSKTEEIFHNIYLNGDWGRQAGGGGVGSDKEQARTASTILHLVVYMYGITSMIDAPCGFVSESWMRPTLEDIYNDLYCFKYHGIDIVSSIMERNIDTFQTFSWMTFQIADLSSPNTTLPSEYELILSRDALQYLPYRSIAGVFQTYCNTNAKYLLVGSFSNSNQNTDIVEPGGKFFIDLLQSPFSFPRPLEIFAEKGVSEENTNKLLLLYHLSDLCQSNGLNSFITSYLGSDKENLT